MIKGFEVIESSGTIFMGREKDYKVNKLSFCLIEHKIKGHQNRWPLNFFIDDSISSYSSISRSNNKRVSGRQF